MLLAVRQVVADQLAFGYLEDLAHARIGQLDTHTKCRDLRFGDGASLLCKIGCVEKCVLRVDARRPPS